ncbi:AtpZ/AtpI family protein [Actinospica durhamensis]|uniref:AtpZ/AtpI family protein n=1 Tax=Actinospica durhamensis TaxID=1508375 RepID=A0A941EZR5_9ACTN|nr:AtpZ/AtpI family protein [Actinospica durhamensis]MBR7837319.1 AtpZ/AtpI family protein [Actinospica durhamensis]
MSPKTRPSHAEPDPRQRDEDDAIERERAEGREMDSMMWTIVGHMAASMLVYGGLGYLLGRWLGHPILLLFGVLFGMVLSLVYTIWLANRSGRDR